jgi:hypothetical protein
MKEKLQTALKAKGFKLKDLAILLNPDKPEQYAAHRLSLLVNGHRTASIKEIKLISEFTGLQLCDLI